MQRFQFICFLTYLLMQSVSYGQSNVGISPAGYLTSRPPEIPILESPLNLDTNIAVTVELTWHLQLHISSYSVQVSKSPDFSDLVTDLDNLSDTSCLVQGLENSTTYYWRVSASNIAGESDYSSEWDFTTIVAIPEAPEPEEPADGSGNAPVDIQFRWNSTENAETYSVQVSKSPDFSGLVTDLDNLSDTSCLVQGLENNTTYYWRVSASNIAGAGDFSGIWSFTTTLASFIRDDIKSTLDKLSIQVFPNPFNSMVTISFELPERTEISLVVYNSMGQAVQVLESGEKQAGRHSFAWDGRDYSGGPVKGSIYYCLLKAEKRIFTHKIILIR